MPSGLAVGSGLPHPAAAVPLPAPTSRSAPGYADPTLALRGSGQDPGPGRGKGGAQQPASVPGNPARVRPYCTMATPLPFCYHISDGAMHVVLM